MALPLAIPLAAPLAPAVAAEAAAVGTLVLGSGAYLAEQAYGFRRGLPPIPRVGGRAGGATLQELLKDAVAGARVGVGSLFPEPWRPPFWAAAAGVVFNKAADFLSQLWGQVASRPTTVLPAPAVDTELLGATGVHGAGGGKIQVYYSASGRRYSGTGASAVCNNSTFTFGPDSYMGEITYLAGEELPEPAWGNSLACGYSSLRINIGGRTDATSQLSRSTSGFSPPGVFTNWAYRLVYVNPVGAQQPASAVLPAPLLPEGYVAPEVGIATAAQEVANTVATPGVATQPVPANAEPVVVTTTKVFLENLPPTVKPQTITPAAPKALPSARPTTNGALVPAAPAAPTATQTDAHFPVSGAGPVTGTGPRPTLEGVASELGRIEQKLARLSNPQTDALGDATDRLGLLLQLLRQLIEYFQSINAGGEYLLSSPCVVNAGGDRIEYGVEYFGAPQALGVISNKIDALALLLQIHKDLKQPNCTQKGTGQPVQVNFIQVE